FRSAHQLGNAVLAQPRSRQTVTHRDALCGAGYAVRSGRRILLAREVANQFAICVEEVERHDLSRWFEPVINGSTRWWIRGARQSAVRARARSAVEVCAIHLARSEQMRAGAHDRGRQLLQSGDVVHDPE